MANTVTTFGNTLVATNIPMTASDVNFTFNSKMSLFWIQCSASTTSMYLASASASNAALALPIAGTAGAPLFMQVPDLAGQTVTFNGTNATNVQIIEYLGHT